MGLGDAPLAALHLGAGQRLAQVTDVLLDAGTYEVLRARLGEQGAELGRRAEALNARRVPTFGSAELRLLGTERIRTENNCVPRDIAQVGGAMLFGYNVFIGLRSETTVDDVFAVHGFSRDGDAFRFDPSDSCPACSTDTGFQRDFAELYRYYQQAKLLQLRRLEGLLLAVFQTGPRADDLRVLRWRVDVDGAVTYVDNRGERDHVFPPAHDFEWTETTREQHVQGKHPHVSIEDAVFVETVGGTLTVKVENNTADGEGVYAEPVDEPLQSLADADIRVRPDRPADPAADPCRTRRTPGATWSSTPAPGTWCGSTASARPASGCPRTTASSSRAATTWPPASARPSTRTSPTWSSSGRSGRSTARTCCTSSTPGPPARYLLLPYNMIRKEVATPIPCHGYSLFDDGTLVAFREMSDEPARVHPMQVWQTPYVSDTYAAAQPVGTGPLERIGNAELVRGISECLSVARMVAEMTPVRAGLRGDGRGLRPALRPLPLARRARAGRPAHPAGRGAGDRRAGARRVRDRAGADRPGRGRGRRRPADRSRRWSAGRAARRPTTTDGWVRQLAALRQAQGQLVGPARAALRRPGPARRARRAAAPRWTTPPEARGRVPPARGRVHRVPGRPSSQLVADAAADRHRRRGRAGRRTAHRAGRRPAGGHRGGRRAGHRRRHRPGRHPGTHRRGARRRSTGPGPPWTPGAASWPRSRAGPSSRPSSRCSGQSVNGALAAADTPERCDEQLARLMLQIEALESRFGEFDDFLQQLGTKRTEVYEAFAGRRQALLDDRARRADRLVDSAERILASVQRRVAVARHAWTRSTPTSPPTRWWPSCGRWPASCVPSATSVRAEELDGRVKAARQEAGRSLRDRLDLYGDGGDDDPARPAHLRGQHPGHRPDHGAGRRRGWPSRSPAPTTGRRSGTPAFDGTRAFWDQPLVSENADGLPRRAPGRGDLRRRSGRGRGPRCRRARCATGAPGGRGPLRRGVRARRARRRRRR